MQQRACASTICIASAQNTTAVSPTFLLGECRTLCVTFSSDLSCIHNKIPLEIRQINSEATIGYPVHSAVCLAKNIQAEAQRMRPDQSR